MMTVLNYKCVNCGRDVKELFKKYSATVLKLMQCDHCMQTADKYIEYDLVIIMIDLVLLNKEAYRHILYNSPFQDHWKLAVILLLTEAYAEWAPLRSVETWPSENGTKQLSDLFEGERSFYAVCLQSLAGSAGFVSLVLLLTVMRWLAWPASRPAGFTLLVLWKGLVLASLGKFLLLPGLIWGVLAADTNAVFTLAYTTLAQIQVYSVVCNAPRLYTSALVVLAGLGVKLATRQLLLG